jgi:transcriptional regulator with XRE-family HTH domain
MADKCNQMLLSCQRFYPHLMTLVTYARPVGIREFGRLLRERRERLGISQRAVARRAGIDASYLSRLEAGDPSYKSVGQDILRHLAAALESDAVEFEASLYDRPLPAPVATLPDYPERIPVVARDVPGSSGASPESYRVVEYVYVPFRFKQGRLLKAITVRGDCMAPMIPDGAIVILDEAAAADVRNGQIVACTWQDEDGRWNAGVKRFFLRGADVHLVPNVGEPIIVPAERVRIEGVAIEVRQRLV